MKFDKPQTMKQQIVRGIVGFGLIAAAIYALMKDQFAIAAVCGGLSIIPLRGCPSCWVAETSELLDKKSGPPGDKPDEPQQG